MQATRVLVLGATGMLGHMLFKYLYNHSTYTVFATCRNFPAAAFTPGEQAQLFYSVDALNLAELRAIIARIAPSIVINCIGIIKQSQLSSDRYLNVSINSLVPHQLAELCESQQARLIHFSTDCVFDGQKGNYQESDTALATDLYGRSKYLGEVDYPHALTLRTSLIGHELRSRGGLLEWFLAQTNSVSGYTHAIFSGLTTYELAQVLLRYILPAPQLNGIYHLSATAISKYELLQLIANVYGKKIALIPCAQVQLNRALNSHKLSREVGYSPKPWPQMIIEMYQQYTGQQYKN